MSIIPGDHTAFLTSALAALSTKAVRELLAKLPIVPEADYAFDGRAPERGWREGSFHWYPVGADLGNQGRIKLAGEPENPIAERCINAIESIIELARRLELKADSSAPAPATPREAVQRYFELPPLEQLPKMPGLIQGKQPRKYAGELARRVRLKLVREKRPVEYGVVIEDDGIGQGASTAHETLLSLGRSDKGDKPYLIGVFGQGGSSAYAASEFSWIISRRAPELGDDPTGEVAWTVIRRLIRPGRIQVHWAYLAAHPDGRVPALSAAAGDAAQLTRGTRIAHLNYDFGKIEPARTLYQALNHLLFKPVLPYEIYTGPERGRDLMWGNAYLLSRLPDETKDLDKPFGAQRVEKKREAD